MFKKISTTFQKASKFGLCVKNVKKKFPEALKIETKFAPMEHLGPPLKFVAQGPVS